MDATKSIVAREADLEPVMTRREVAHFLRQSLRATDYMIRNGTLKSFAIGGRRLIPVSSIRALIKAACRADPEGDAGDGE